MAEGVKYNGIGDLLNAEFPDLEVESKVSNYYGKPLELTASIKGPIERLEAFTKRAEELGLSVDLEIDPDG